MPVNLENSQTSRATEVAGEATVDSAPAERDSSDGVQGVEHDADNQAQLPGPIYDVDPRPDSSDSEAGQP